MAWKVLESKLQRLQPAKQPLETTRNFESQLAALFRDTVPFKSIWPSPVPGLVAAAEIGHLSPVPS